MIIQFQTLYNLITDLFIKLHFNPEHAKQIADVLIAAELRGISSHGLLRLPEYVNLCDQKKINTNPIIKIVHETPSTALIDGDSTLGMISGHQAMNLAMRKAESCGTGWVVVNNSHHYGIAGFYPMMALQKDMIGISMTNANPLVAPTFAKQGMLGTNPIAIAFPTDNEPPFIADFATAPIARGRLDVLHLKGLDAPIGFVQDENGNPSTDSNILSKGGSILPLGSDYEHGSHKGYCLTAIVDILSAVLPGANFGPFIVPTLDYRKDTKANPQGKGIGHFFGAMRIDAFRPADEFKTSMDTWIQAFRNAEPIAGHEKVLIPGDPERELTLKYMKEGIPILEQVAKKITPILDRFELSLTQ